MDGSMPAGPRVFRRSLAVVTGVLVPLLLGAGLVASAAKGGPGVRLGASLFRVERVPEVPFTWGSTEPVFVLVMGNDARPGQTTSRADALHLVGVSPATGQATILNIPRDTWMAVPGRGQDKINSAHLVGGPALQARAVGELVGVAVPYVVSTGFDGFEAMVDELGGVTVEVPAAMADPASGAYFDAGPVHMLGGDALAFSRNRNLAGGDFTRTHDQSLVIVAALAKLRSEGVSASRTAALISLLLRHGSVEGAGGEDLYRLGRLALSIDPANVRSVTMPGSVGWAGGQSVVFKSPAADALFADFRDDAVLQSH